jgi:hypothetical protein
MTTYAPTMNKNGQVIFSSPRAILEAADDAFLWDDKSWMNETKAEYLKKTSTGDVSKVAAAEALLNKIEPELNRDSVVWSNAMVGSHPDVGAFLANDPECMRRRHVTEDERSPLRVWVDVSSSACISWEDLLPRGIAALALVMQLIRSGRAVELWTFCSLHGAVAGQTVPCVQMCTTPIDVASVAYCLTAQGFSRGVCYGVARQYNRFNGGWGRNYVRHGSLAERIAGARKTLAGLVAPQDIILPAPFYDDKHDKGDAGLIFRDPVKWVLETCKRANEGGEQ